MEFVVLGSGAFAPSMEDPPEDVRNPAGYAALLGGKTLLFDFGFGNLRQLYKAGIDPASITHAFFSHRHPDHVGDLAALLFHFRYDRKPATGRLCVYGPRGFKGFFERLTKAHHPWLKPRGYAIRLEELEEGAVVKGPGWRVRAREVPHSTEAVAYRLDTPRASLAYTGDTGFDPGLAAFARGVDLFVLECSLTEADRYPHHLRVSQALELYGASRAKRGLFTHLSRGSARELARRLASRSRSRRSKAGLARDLQRVQLP